MTPILNDAADDLLLADRETTVITQATGAHDHFPAPYGAQEDEEAIFAGLSGPAARKRNVVAKRLAKAGVAPARRMGGFMPGMGEDFFDQVDGLGAAPNRRAVRRAAPAQRAVPARRMGGFMPGMGDADELEGLGAVPNRLRPRVRTSRTPASSRPMAAAAPARRMGGFMPGMGGIELLGLGVPALIAVGVGAYFLLRKR